MRSPVGPGQMRQVPEIWPVPARLRAQMQSLPAGTVPVAVKTWPKPAQMRRRGDPNAAPAINATQPTNCVQARPRDACTQGTCSTRRLRACTRMCVHTTPCPRTRASLSLCARACASVPYGRTGTPPRASSSARTLRRRQQAASAPPPHHTRARESAALPCARWNGRPRRNGKT